MFSDSQVAKDFDMGPNKTGYVINYGLAPFFKEQLQDELRKSPCYIMSFDESLNKITQSCQMDLLVRFWNSVKDIGIQNF